MNEFVYSELWRYNKSFIVRNEINIIKIFMRYSGIKPREYTIVSVHYRLMRSGSGCEMYFVFDIDTNFILDSNQTRLVNIAF